MSPENIIAGTSLAAVIAVIILALAAILMPIFVIIIASRAYRCAESLRRLEKIMAAQARRP